MGNDMKYQPMTMSATDAQLLEQLKWTAETVVGVFHVPAYKVGVAPAPTYNNIEALNQGYYSDCLQVLIENIEKLLDDGLELPKPLGTEFDTEGGLFRMDSVNRVQAAMNAIKSGGMSPDEARKRYFDLGPVTGGASPYMQIQNYSLEALARRDANSNPVTPGLDQSAEPAENEDDEPDAEDSAGADIEIEEAERAIREWVRWHDGARAA